MVSKVIVFGAHGKIGQRLLRIIGGTTKYSATAVVRNSEQAEQINKISKNSQNVKTTELELSVPTSEIAKAIKGHDAVVVTVGSGGKSLLKVDLDGVVKTFEAAVESNVRRLVLVSAVFADDREFGAKSQLHEYYIAKHYADRILIHEFGKSLDYTILKPTGLTDGNGLGKIDFLTNSKHNFGTVDREDVALSIFEVLNNPATFGKSYNFHNGSKPVDDPKTWE